MTGVASVRLTRDQWPFVGLGALVVVTAILVFLAVSRTWSPPTQAVPAPAVATSTSPSETTPTPTATVPRTGLAGIADVINSTDGASILVIGDGSGDESDEWVSVWARDYLAQQATVSYGVWNATAARYADAVRLGSTTRAVSLWNASVSSPTMAREPERIAKAWRDADVVLLSYGHQRSAKDIATQLDAVLAAVRQQSDSVPVAVLIQNPDRTKTEASQRETTLAIQKWAGAKGFPTVDIYSAFTADPAPRTDLVESDGSPTPKGSQLWAKTLAQALGAQPAR